MIPPSAVDVIHIEQLELPAVIGVPASERTAPQRLTANVTLAPNRDFRSLDDSLENAVDYSRVGEAMVDLCRAGSRHLLETLAEEIAGMLLRDFPLRSVELELRKYILPSTEYVSVRIRRQAGSSYA